MPQDAVRRFCISDVQIEAETVLEVSAEFTYPYVTADIPPKLELRVTNPTDDTAILGKSDEMPNPTWSRKEPPELVLLPKSHAHTPDHGNWELQSDTEITGSGMAPSTRIEPGETVTLEYVVWDSGRTDGYFRPGVYAFEINMGGEVHTEIGLKVSEVSETSTSP